MKQKNYQKTKESLLGELNSQSIGLTTAQAQKQQEVYGFNEISEGNKKNCFLIFLEQYKDFLVLILIAAAVISAILGDVESAAVIFVVITVNAILGTVQQMKADNSLNSLKQLSAPNAKVLRDGNVVILPSREITVGDIVLLEAGDSVCADGRIMENASLKINESALTGESVSVDKEDTLLTQECSLGDQVNMVFSGSFVTYGRGSFLVTDIGMNTEVGKIAAMIKNTKEKKTPLQVNLDQFGQKLSIVILAICAVLFAVSLLRGQPVMDSFMFAVALAVAAIPEALSSIVTIVLSFGTQKMAKENAIIRKLQAVEGLGSVSIICSDKTGTLTQNKMTVKKYYINQEILDASQAHFERSDDKKLLLFSVLCNDSTNEEGVEIGDPTETALINFADQYGYYSKEIRSTYPRISEIPFDSDRKLMSTVHEMDGKNILVTKGAVDVLLSRMSIDPDTKKQIEQANEYFSQSGLRVLAFAYKEIENTSINFNCENDLTFLGLIAMMDPPREESAKAVAECIQAGIKPIMITGDHKVTAAAIAKQIGILHDASEAVEGSEIDSLSDEELKDFVPHITVYARVSPEHKIRIVRAWQERGNIVSMTGDGVNDAPALKQADIGVAMGITGTEVSKDAASMVLTDDNFATIVKAIENGRNVYANIKRSIQFLLSGNTAGILAVLYASLLGLPVPFAPVHLLFINLLTDSLPAIALGLEPHTADVMNEKPRPMNESILTKDFMISILTEGLIICAVTLAAFHIGLSYGGSGMGSTMAFATLCLSRLTHGFNCKSLKPVLFTKKFNNNGYLWGAFIIGFVLLNLVLLVPACAGLFQVTALPLPLLFTIYGLALANLFMIQLIKFIRCRLLK